jgi:ABC-type dipeptide/oligopeptide/nickel transport system permease subunit
MIKRWNILLKQQIKKFFLFLLHHKLFSIGLILFLTISSLSLFGPFFLLHSPYEMGNHQTLLAPIWSSSSHHSAFLLGTDDLGRDLASRLLYGGRYSLGVGLLVVLLSFSLGTFLGILSGLFPRWGTYLIDWPITFLLSIPSMLLAIMIVSILGPGLVNAIYAVTLVSLPPFVKMAKALTREEKEKPYLLLAKTYGVSTGRFILIHLLPNVMKPLCLQATLSFGQAILEVAALGFLGLGAQAPEPEWGTMLSDARLHLESSPWFATLPGLCLFLTVAAFNLMGEGLQRKNFSRDETHAS